MNKNIEVCEETFEVITITKDYFNQLHRDSEWLYYLQKAGVDNWEGYGYALELRKEETQCRQDAQKLLESE